jgi:hypothetical protein
MAKGMKIHKYDAAGEYGATQIDQAINPQTVTLLTATGTNTTTYLGGVGGKFANTTQLTILVNYKTSAGVAKTDGQILQQRGRKQFNVLSAADTNPAKPTLTRCTLVASGTLAASQCYIKAVAPDGTAFYASRISNRFVWNGDTRYRYTVVNSTQLAFIDLYNLGTTTNAGDDLAVVEGA